MPLLTPHEGLQFSISKLDGSLAFTLFLNGKRVSKSEIFDIDSGPSPKIEFSTFNGPHITAVGLELFLVKNYVTLKLEYTGHNGASGSWVFRGLELDNGVEEHPKKYMAATAQTQTDTVTTRMMEVQTETPVMKESEMKSSTAAMKNMAVQTKSPNACGIIDQKKPAKEIELGFGLKRKTLIQPEAPNKRAKSTSSSEQWPKYLFMSCDIDFPLFWGSYGTLIMDLENAKVWLTREDTKRTIVKHIDLQDPTTKAIYNPLTNSLTLKRYLCPETEEMFFQVYEDSAVDSIWGNYNGSETKRHVYTDPTIVLDAIVHCIDRSSRRKPIHDPDVRPKYEKANARYEALDKKGLLHYRLNGPVTHSRPQWNKLKKEEQDRLREYKEKRQYIG